MNSVLMTLCISDAAQQIAQLIPSIQQSIIEKYEHIELFKLVPSFLKDYRVTVSDMSNPKVLYRYLCYRYLDQIRRIQVPNIVQGCSNEAVFIEMRSLPHAEYIIRNAVLKLGTGWSFTVICGQQNKEYMHDMCAKIHPAINMIVAPYDNLMPHEYNQYLSSAPFWQQLTGDKVLIYQEDSCIFRTNINEFLQWDYIGAAWPLTNNDTPNRVGNGGLSLRSRQCMLDVIAARGIMDTSYNSSTVAYMTANGLTVPPEDVYFSKTMQELGIGTVAPWKDAVRFSTESILDKNSFGGHNFWLCDPRGWTSRIIYNNVQLAYTFTTDQNGHRGGWKSILNAMNAASIFNFKAPMQLIDVVEYYFIWRKAPPITTPWVGFLHNVLNTPAYLQKDNIKEIFKERNFIHSLKACKAIFVLATCLKDYLDTMFARLNINIPVYFLKHSVDFDVPEFSMEKYMENADKKLIQIGQQLRKMTSIYKIDVSDHRKLWLTGNKNVEMARRRLQRELYGLGLPAIPDAEKLMYYTSTFEEYDELLTQNIAFLDLFDAAANNTVVECIVRNTPLLVNKVGGVIDYLGEDYPLYYKDHSEIQSLLTVEKIREGYEYLAKMNKADLTHTHFTNCFLQRIYQIINQ